MQSCAEFNFFQQEEALSGTKYTAFTKGEYDMADAKQETMEFQTELKQLMDIIVNSLYTDREIFLREVISNASDALEKLRYIQITEKEIADPDIPLEIKVQGDEDAKTLTITDTGIGMTRQELVENLGTIAHSGSKAFLKHLSEGNQQDVNLIGQFGVGFYSVFMVAEKVELYTRSYKRSAAPCLWTSSGGSEFSIGEAQGIPRGTKIVLYLKEDAREFAKTENLKRIIKEYSSFVPFPILVNGERVNTIKAIWTKNRNEVSDAEYTEFFKYISNSLDGPLYRLHFSSDAPLAINAVLFVPKENLERFGFGRLKPGVNVYSRNVLIQQESEGILPEWMRFVKGVVESEELPLNISRETVQDSALVAKLRRVITRRFLRFLKDEAEKNKETYSEFWKAFGLFIKEGVATDFDFKNDLVELLRFESSKLDKGELTSLKDYVDRMKDDQKAIYYLNGRDREMTSASPYMEIFKEKDMEVLYTYDTVDDYVLGSIGQYQEKDLVAADTGAVDLKAKEEEGDTGKEDEKSAASLVEWMKEVLGDRVVDVKVSKRLVDSPALVIDSSGMSSGMQRIIQMMDQERKAFTGAKVLELNPGHPVIAGLCGLKEKDEDLAKLVAHQILDNALLSANLNIDTHSMVNRVYNILEKAVQP